MQLTRYTDYSLRVLLYLSLHKEQQRITITDISNHFEIPRNHLVKVVHQLGLLGYIRTARGKNGGITLSDNGCDIRIGDVVRHMETTMDIVNCESPSPCPIGGNCKLKSILDEATDAFIAALDKYTLADLGKKPNRLKALLRI